MEVSGITLSSDKEEIEIGETAKLSAFADGKEIAPGFVKFESLTSNIATVAIDGTVTPLAEGEAEFKVTALDLTATVKINVKAKSTVEEIVEGVALGILTNYREAAGGVAAEGYIINEKATIVRALIIKPCSPISITHLLCIKIAQHFHQRQSQDLWCIRIFYSPS